MPSFDSNTRFVYFHAKGARARVYFPISYFWHFVAQIDFFSLYVVFRIEGPEELDPLSLHKIVRNYAVNKI